MIRTLLTTTAVAMLMTAGVIAQDATTTAPANDTAPAAGTEQPANTTETPAATTGNDAAATAAPVESGATEETDVDEPWDMSAGYVAVDSDNLASELIDQPVYSSTGDDAEEIGNVTDVVFSEDGRMTAVVIGVGGFLGIGEKSVAVPFDLLEFTLASDNTERWVVPTTAEALTAAPEFVWSEDEPADGDDAAATDDAAVAPAADAGAMAPADTTTMAPATDATAAPAADTAAAPAAAPMAMPREGYNTVGAEALTADNLDGATVIGPDGNDIAEVEDILLTADGKVDALLVDFGGFLGLGQKTVAVGLENLEFAANEGGDLVIYSDFTREQLEAQPDYDEATYATTPAQRITDQ